MQKVSETDFKVRERQFLIDVGCEGLFNFINRVEGVEKIFRTPSVLVPLGGGTVPQVKKKGLELAQKPGPGRLPEFGKVIFPAPRLEPSTKAVRCRLRFRSRRRLVKRRSAACSSGTASWTSADWALDRLAPCDWHGGRLARRHTDLERAGLKGVQQMGFIFHQKEKDRISGRLLQGLQKCVRRLRGQALSPL